MNENDGTRRSRGTDGSNPVPSTGESSANRTSSDSCRARTVHGGTDIGAGKQMGEEDAPQFALAEEWLSSDTVR